ncbi:pirin family protein [Undibacterium sp. Jales W-56]|uniref:pirin family protein n=1 Tax=Undibacterium sp. Jales W-56 TaxID=2897325 RepID=UPI0021D2FE90|nr:pirin family protein [Undibacterium sp. Jales W-56]MCU6435568.1 pirin family protein [Undibacterium sp. Jales W-56]
MTSIRKLIRGQARDIGFPIRRLLPDAEVRRIGPFVFFDHMGPAVFEAGTQAGDVRPHPHIGLATVTYLFSGAMMHRDSLGNVQRIVPGDINWMTAGRGIVHSERMPEDIREQQIAVQGLQMWVALPERDEEIAPNFQHYAAEQLPRAMFPGVQLHVLAGQAFGQNSPVVCHSPTLYVAAWLEAGASLEISSETANYPERGLYVVSGSVTVNEQVVDAGTLIVLEERNSVSVTANVSAVLMLLGGAALESSPRLWWNFVSSSKERIEAAKLAWASQDKNVFPPVPGESERIPLPDRQ